MVVLKIHDIKQEARQAFCFTFKDKTVNIQFVFNILLLMQKMSFKSSLQTLCFIIFSLLIILESINTAIVILNDLGY